MKTLILHILMITTVIIVNDLYAERCISRPCPTEFLIVATLAVTIVNLWYLRLFVKTIIKFLTKKTENP